MPPTEKTSYLGQTTYYKQKNSFFFEIYYFHLKLFMSLYSAKNLTSFGNEFHFASLMETPSEQNRSETYGCFRLGPFKGTKSLTFANLLRRTLLSEIPGTGMIQATFQQPTHEFSILPGVQESVIDIILNLKQLILEGYCGAYTRGTISKKGPGVLTANELNLPYPIVASYPEQVIAHINTGFDFKMDFILKTGKGSTLPMLKKSLAPSSSILIQNDFNPIQKVNYTICEERLTEWIELEIWTNGSIKPYLALQTAVYTLLQEFQFLYPKTLELSNSPFQNIFNIQPLRKSSTKKIENMFLPIEMYKGLKCSKINDEETFEDFKDWDLFSKKFKIPTDSLKPFFPKN